MSTMGKKLLPLAITRESKHWQEVLELLNSIIQQGPPFDGEDELAIREARQYQTDVPDPEEESLFEKRRNSHEVLSA